MRKPDQRRWWPLLLLPPLLLLAWALVGVTLTFGRYGFTTEWIPPASWDEEGGALAAAPRGDYVIWTPRVSLSIPVGRWAFYTSFDEGSNPTFGSTPMTRVRQPLEPD